MSNDSSSYYAGLDIGGSTVKAVLVNHRSEQVGPIAEVRSLVKDGYEATFGQLDTILDQLAAGAGIDRSAIAGIGLDVPAPSSDGVIWGRANLGDDWVGTDIRGKFSARTGVPVHMTNDCNAAAMGEYALRHKHLGSLLLVAPGTGLGGGFVLPGGAQLRGRQRPRAGSRPHQRAVPRGRSILRSRRPSSNGRSAATPRRRSAWPTRRRNYFTEPGSGPARRSRRTAPRRGT